MYLNDGTTPTRGVGAVASLDMMRRTMPPQPKMRRLIPSPLLPWKVPGILTAPAPPPHVLTAPAPGAPDIGLGPVATTVKPPRPLPQMPILSRPKVSTLPTVMTAPAPAPPTSAKAGIPMWMWVGGGALAAILLLR